jgi:hypothetical protein
MDQHHRMFDGSLGLLAVAFLISCSSSKPPISVAVSAPASQTDQGQTITITSSVTNDPSGQGAKWSLTGSGSLSSTAGVSVTYTAPAASNIKTVQSATVTATSVSDPSKSASLQISVNPLPFFTSLLPFPSANVGVSYNQSIGVTGGTQPLTWAISDGTTVPAGLSFNTSNGTISGTPTQGGTWYFAAQVTDAVGITFNWNFYSIEVQQQISGTNPVPFLTQPLVPSSITPGGPPFILTVNGTGFLSSSTVDFDGAALPTTFVNQGQLEAAVPAASIASSATHSVTVVSPAPGGGSSNAIYFPVAPPEAGPNFTLGPALPITPGPGQVEYLAVADFNHDGKTDLAIGYDRNLAVLLGNGDGSFAIAGGSPFLNPAPPFNNAPGILQTVSGLIVGDFFNSGHPGLAVAGFQNQDVAVFNGNGDGTMTLSPTAVWIHGSPTVSPVAADLNGDGNLDLLVGNSFAGVPVVASLGYGDGAFNIQPLFPNISSAVSALAIGDFNGDGKLDFAVCLVGFSFTTVGVEVFLGNGDGSFTQVPGTMAMGDQTSGIVVADFNGDGKLDLAFADAAGNTSNVQVMLGKGDGTFVPAQGSPIQMPGFQPVSTLVGDFLNHGKLDLVVTGSSQNGNHLNFLPGNGDGTFQSAIPLNFGGPQAAGDFNGSGRLGFAAESEVVIQP